MPHHIEQQPDVVIIHYTGEVDEAEAKIIEGKLNAILETATKPTYYIAAIEDVITFPAQMVLRRENMSYIQHPRLAYTVIAGGTNHLIRLVGNTLSRVVGFRHQFADTLEEALVIVEKLKNQ